MTSNTNPSVVPSSTGLAGAPADPYILTLCRLAAPAAIRPPQAPHLKPFTFFTSRAAQPDGSERLYLHMGYFATLAHAEKWAQLMRAAYPNATPMRAPVTLPRKRDATVPTAAPPAPESVPAHRAPAGDGVLTDTQVMRILDTRGFTAEPGDTAIRQSASISLLKPEDSQVRRTLKAAVAQQAPVSFAVQLSRTPHPLDASQIPSLSIFKAYTLYSTPDSRDGSSHALRLGFFSDAISAKQVAYYVRSSFESVAVVPITEDERTRAASNPIDVTKLSEPQRPKDCVRERIDQVLEADRGSAKPAQAVPATPAPSTPKRRKQSLEETLEMLAASEIWNDSDSHTETGVRHLKVDIQKRTAKR